jgi:hypothetical protein
MSNFDRDVSYVRSFGPYVGNELEFYLVRDNKEADLSDPVAVCAEALYKLPAPSSDMSPRDYSLMAMDLKRGLTYEQRREAELRAVVDGIRNGTFDEDKKIGKAYTNFDPGLVGGGYEFYEHARSEIEAAGGYCPPGGALGL